LGTYAYPASGGSSVRPHAVSQVTLNAGAGGGKITFAYDANGSLTTQTQTNASNAVVAAKSRSQFYTSFNMPQSMSQGTISAAFYYGPEHQRVKQVSSVQGTTIYVNPGNTGALFYEKDIKPNGSVEQRAFISAGGQAVAVVKTTTAGGTTTTVTRYLHRDSLGSVSAITNESGAVLERLSYEPFGKRRFANGANDPNNTIKPANTVRGFTGHEMLDDIGLVHMNGRVYDPLVSRFLSADPFIQSPYSLQSYNRYSYVWNNPLGSTDPSGYFSLSKTLKSAAKFFVAPSAKTAFDLVASMPGQKAVDNFTLNNSWAYTGGLVIGAAAATYWGGPLGGASHSGVWTSYFTYRSTNSITEAHKAGAIAFATSYAFNWVGGNVSNPFLSVAAHSAVGCASAAASGGNCSQGALAAGFGKFATLHMPTAFQGNHAYQFTYVSVVGGTASVLGGGKFANGATTAAFGYLFNHLVTENTKRAGGFHRRLVVRDDNGFALYGFSFRWDGDEHPFFNNFFQLATPPAAGASGNGIVYVDIYDRTTTTLTTFRTTAAEDLLIVEYMKTRIGDTAPYNVVTNNCRIFSTVEYNKITNEINRARDEGRLPVFK
ncbi:MAG: DUF637 domain-containing protein, partial [Betaproteobacteria bacterium]|nr:DUF637 domain-containing protein [Betaproteobacteria bacterium]